MTTTPPLPFRFARTASILGVLWLLGAGSPPTDGLRPTDVTLEIVNSPRYSGSYSASGNSRVCGTLTYGYPHRANAFTVEFPDDEPDLPVRSVRFDADTLAAGTTTTSFYLDVGVTTPQGGTPPSFVVRASQPQYHETGTAELQAKGGTTELRVEGTNDMGVKLELAVVCHP